jgi:hypothetical protein
MCSYLSSNIQRIQEYIEKTGQLGVDELNTVADKHVITICHDDTGEVSYTGCDIRDGRLRILFTEDYYGSWQGDAFRDLDQAVNKAEHPAGSEAPVLSFAARTSIQKQYEPQIGAVEARIAKILAMRDIKLTPNFEAVIAKLKAAGETPSQFEPRIGEVSLAYFSKFADKLVEQKFDSDDMLQEGLQEALTGKEIALRVKDPLVQSSYNEVELEDGVLYIQVRARGLRKSQPSNGSRGLLADCVFAERPWLLGIVPRRPSQQSDQSPVIYDCRSQRPTSQKKNAAMMCLPLWFVKSLVDRRVT